MPPIASMDMHPKYLQYYVQNVNGQLYTQAAIVYLSTRAGIPTTMKSKFQLCNTNDHYNNTDATCAYYYKLSDYFLFHSCSRFMCTARYYRM